MLPLSLSAPLLVAGGDGKESLAILWAGDRTRPPELLKLRRPRVCVPRPTGRAVWLLPCPGVTCLSRLKLLVTELGSWWWWCWEEDEGDRVFSGDESEGSPPSSSSSSSSSALTDRLLLLLLLMLLLLLLLVLIVPPDTEEPVLIEECLECPLLSSLLLVLLLFGFPTFPRPAPACP